MSTSNIDIPNVTGGQDDKILAINAAHEALDVAITNQLTIANSGGTSTTLTAQQTVGNKGYVVTGATAATHTLYLQANEKFFWIKDETTGGNTLQVRVTGDVGTAAVVQKGTDAYSCMYCDGTNVTLIQVAGAPSPTDEAAYIDLTLAADQTTSIGDGDQVAFDTVGPSNVITNASGVITLPAGSRDFVLMAQVVAIFSTGSGSVTLQWYDIDGAAFVGKEMVLEPETGANKSGTGTMVTLFTGPVGANDVELRINGAPTNLSGFESDGTKVIIQQVSSVSSVVGITEVISMHIAAVTLNDVIVLEEYAKYDYTVTNLRHKLNTGTATLDFAINGTSITGLGAVSATSVQGSDTGTALNAVTVGDRLTVTIDAVGSSPDNLSFTLELTRDS